VLSAKPLAISQPNPFDEDLKIDMMPEMDLEPLTLDTQYENYLQIGSLKANLDTFVRTRSQQILIKDICNKLDSMNQQDTKSPPTRLVISSLVLYIERLGFSKHASLQRSDCV